MNITFLIGNGFDINLGLRTRYSDFYPYFINKCSEKNIIKGWLIKDEMRWADLEKKLGEKVQYVTEENKEQFYESKEELDSLLLDYLKNEQNKFNLAGRENEIAGIFADNLTNFYSDFPEAESASLASTIYTFSGEEFKYCFLCFNYTDTLDRIINVTRKIKTPISTHKSGSRTLNNTLGSLIHIHGTVNQDMILGVNDTDQINNDMLKKDSEFLDTFIKINMNNGIGQNKIKHANQMISNSHIICIFGMSLGYTDKMWWKELIMWLQKSGQNKLVIFNKGSMDEEQQYVRLSSSRIRINNSIKERFFKASGSVFDSKEKNSLKNRIFIKYNSKIFKF